MSAGCLIKTFWLDDLLLYIFFFQIIRRKKWGKEIQTWISNLKGLEKHLNCVYLSYGVFGLIQYQKCNLRECVRKCAVTKCLPALPSLE